MQSAWGTPKSVITNLKLNNFKEKNQQENLIAIFVSQINLHKHVSMKINTYRMYQGGGGVWGANPPPPPQKQKKLKKKIKQNGAFSLFFFLLFGKATYIPKIMNLLPTSPKIITSAPQLPKNK